MVPPDFDKLSFHNGSLTVQRSGTSIHVETDFGLIVENDGTWVSLIKIPASLRNMMEGLCGNNNGDPDDDLVTSAGEDVSGDPASFSLVGNSWQVADPEVPV